MRLAPALFVTAACASLALVPAPNPLVAPGRSLGNIRLSAPADSLAWLGPTSFGDAAMQKAWATWFSKAGKANDTPHQIDVYTTGVGPDLRKEVQLIRATSPWFHTVEGIRVGSTLATVKAACGPLTLAETYTTAPQAGPRYLYDNARAGIAFELNGQTATSRCMAIIVHQPGQKVNETYLSMTQYLKEVSLQPKH